eukprot:gene2786-1010_t
MAAYQLLSAGLMLVFLIGLSTSGAESKCQDLDGRCKHWASKGECRNNADFMRRNCQMSCKICQEAVLQAILEDSNNQIMYAIGFVLIAVIGFTIAGIRVYFAGGSCGSLAKLKGKTVIVTGANTGIGKQAALSFAGRGAKVILACRNYSRGLKTMKYIRDLSENKTVEFRKLDLSSFESIKEFAKEFNAEEDRLDILVNNAGVLTGSKRQVTEDGHEEMFQVNYLGPFLLTNLLLDKLKQSTPSRIINVSSAVHHQSKGLDFQDLEMEQKFDRMKQLVQTKLANILFTHELSKKLEGTGVTANCLHPGFVRTEATRNVGILQWRLVKIVLLPFRLFFMKTARQGAQTTIHCAVDPALENISGKYFVDCQESDVSPIAKDDGAAKKLWEVSERLTGLNQ